MPAQNPAHAPTPAWRRFTAPRGMTRKNGWTGHMLRCTTLVHPPSTGLMGSLRFRSSSALACGGRRGVRARGSCIWRQELQGPQPSFHPRPACPAVHHHNLSPPRGGVCACPRRPLRLPAALPASPPPCAAPPPSPPPSAPRAGPACAAALADPPLQPGWGHEQQRFPARTRLGAAAG